jgi:hypothetical protein
VNAVDIELGKVPPIPEDVMPVRCPTGRSIIWDTPDCRWRTKSMDRTSELYQFIRYTKARKLATESDSEIKYPGGEFLEWYGSKVFDDLERKEGMWR